MSNLTHQPEAPHDATRQRSLFARNSAALAAANAYTIATSILFVPLLTRYLGREGYGVYNQVYALVQLLAVLSHLGTHAILTREAARAKEQASLLLGQVITLQLVLTIVFSAAVGIAAWISRVPSQVWILVILCAGESVLRVLSNTALAVSRAFEKMGHELIATVVDRTIWLAGIGLVIAADLGLVAVFVIFLVAALMRLAVSFGLLLRLIPPPRLGLQRAVGRGLLRESWPIGAGQGIRQAYERVSIIQLGAAMDAAAVGLFSGAARIFQLTDTMLTSFSTALFPAMSEAASVNGRLQKLTS
ncbi:MAG: oligosaccharide flippase family protein, partial [Anaerolineales bacterium]|nr:oligosaccharide flippase family protein [Anaerolineales bacterium]